MSTPFAVGIAPDAEGFIKCLQRTETPERVHNIELFIDVEVQAALCERYGLTNGLAPDDPFFPQKLHMAVQSFLGYDFVTPINTPSTPTSPYARIMSHVYSRTRSRKLSTSSRCS